MLLLLTQTSAIAVAPSPLSTPLGAWLAIIVAALAILGGVYRLGVTQADVRNMKSNVESELRNLSHKLDAITRHIEDSRELQLQSASWRATTDSRLQHLENAEIDRRVGPSDRRNHP